MPDATEVKDNAFEIFKSIGISSETNKSRVLMALIIRDGMYVLAAAIDRADLWKGK